LATTWFLFQTPSTSKNPVQNNSIFGRELLALYLSIRHHLEARQLFVLTDHKPFTYVEKFGIWTSFPNLQPISVMLVETTTQLPMP
jgi:hypothetical protein